MLKVKISSLEISKLRSFFIPGAIVVFILASALFLIRPRASEIFLIQKNLEKEEKRLAQLTAKTAALEGLDQVELSEKVEIAARALLSEKNLPLLISVIKNLAAKNNIELRSLQVDPGELEPVPVKGNEEKLPSLSFKITVSGKIADFKEFLTQLHKIAPLMRVQSIAVDTERVEGSLQVSLPLEVPFLPPPTVLGLPEKPLTQITREEETVWQKLTQLNFAFITVTEEMPAVPAGKENPFAF